MNASKKTGQILSASGGPLNSFQRERPETSEKPEARDWISPQELKKKWRKKEVVRAAFLLLASHLLSWGVFFSGEPGPPPVQKVEKGHILIQLPGQLLMQDFKGGKMAVSLFNERGRFLSHSYLNNNGGRFFSGEKQLVSLEIPASKLAKILKEKGDGLIVAPRGDKVPLKKKEARIYEVDF